MIRINLLPTDMAVAPSTRINPTLPLSAAVIFPALILVPFHLHQVATERRLQTEVAGLNRELDSLKPVIAQIEALEGAKVQLGQRKSVIQTLESERLRYPEFLDDFLKLIPNNLWLTNLATTAQAANGALTVQMDVVALDNYAIADLVANLETSQIFSDVDLGTISAAQTPSGQTMSFHLTANYKKVDTLPNAPKKS